MITLGISIKANKLDPQLRGLKYGLIGDMYVLPSYGASIWDQCSAPKYGAMMGGLVIISLEPDSP